MNHNIPILRGDENIEFVRTKSIDKDVKTIKLKKTSELESHERMSIMSDVFFKTMMLNEGRIKYSCKLLSYILNFEYEELLEKMRFTKNYFDKDVVKEKGIVGDFLAEMEDVEISIEVNVNRNENRNFHYLTKLFSSSVKSGSNTNEGYHPVVQINFNNYVYEKDKKTKRTVRLMDEDGKVFLDIYIVEYYLPNIIEKMYNNGNKALSEDERIVLAMFTEDKNIALELSKGDDVLDEFASDIEVAMQDDELKEAYDHFLDYGSGMRKEGYEEGFEQGVEQGLEQGIEQGKKDSMLMLAKKMLKSGYKKEEVIQLSGLTLEEIDVLDKE